MASTTDKPPGSMRQRVRKRKPDARLTHLHTLQTHVHRLHQEVESLKLTRQLLYDRHLQRADQFGGSYERVVREYFDLFRFGMQLGHGHGVASVPSRLRVQSSTERFLRAILDENVNYSGPEPGVDRFVDMNKMYALAFRDNRLTLLDLKVFPVERDVVSWDNAPVTVSGWGQYSCLITPTTIEMLFPHIKTNHALVAKLLGQHITGVGRYDFVFDTETNRVIATAADLNFVTVFMAALKNPSEVALLLDQAHISSEYVISSPVTSPTGSPTSAKDDAAVAASERVVAPSASNRIRMAQLLT